jgi:hypothetical protein
VDDEKEVRFSNPHINFSRRCEMKLIKKLSLLLMSIFIFIGLAATSFQPVSAAVVDPKTCTKWHTVQKGEYLSMIAEIYDTNWYSIVDINDIKNPSLIYTGNRLCIFQSGYSSNPPASPFTYSSSANVSALSSKEDQSVTLQGKNLNASSPYNVYLGKYKADSSQRLLVGSIYTDKNGYFKETFTIPKKLYDVLKIGISVTNQRGVSTSNWFINTTSKVNTGGVGSQELSIDVQSVKKGQWVKIETENLPANVSFNVYMIKPGASLRKAILVGKLRDPKGGDVAATFEIPGALKDRSMLEIMVVNNALEMNAEAVFDNKTIR